MGFLRQLWSGGRMVNSLVSGKFDNSPGGQQFASWFRERPGREEQRQMFVQIAMGLHCPSGIVADRLMHCITEVWCGQSARFGDMLAQEMDRLIIFGPPKDAYQAERQQSAKQGLADLKARLRALDRG